LVAKKKFQFLLYSSRLYFLLALVCRMLVGQKFEKHSKLYFSKSFVVSKHVGNVLKSGLAKVGFGLREQLRNCAKCDIKKPRGGIRDRNCLSLSGGGKSPPMSVVCVPPCMYLSHCLRIASCCVLSLLVLHRGPLGFWKRPHWRWAPVVCVFDRRSSRKIRMAGRSARRK
jgi:hypothetical protein